MPRQRTKIEVNLFPFLSVLCCMIGVFMLFMVIILSTRAIEAEDNQRQATASKSAKGDKHEGASDEESEAADGIDRETWHALDRRLTELTGLLAHRQRQRDNLASRLEQLAAALETKQDELAAMHMTRRRKIVLDAPDPVRPVPDPHFKVDKRPVFVEISAEGYMLQPEGTRFPALQKKRVGKEDRYVADAGLKQFVERVDDNRQKEYFLLLIHPNGVAAYDAFRGYLLQEFSEPVEIVSGQFILRGLKERVDIGVEPFSRDWEFVAEQP